MSPTRSRLNSLENSLHPALFATLMTADIKPSKNIDEIFREVLLDEVNKAIRISCENYMTKTIMKQGDGEIKTELSEASHIKLLNDAEDELPFGFFNDVSTLKSYPGKKNSSVPNFVAPVVLLASSLDLDLTYMFHSCYQLYSPDLV